MQLKQLQIATILAFSAIGLSPMAAAGDVRTVETNLDEASCAHVSGDYGAPLAILEVKSDCVGENGWTVKFTETANHQKIGFQYGENEASPDLKVLWFGRNGSFTNLDWVYKNETPLGVTFGYNEFGAGPDPTDQAFNQYAVALKTDQSPSACIIGRVEAMEKRGAPSAAKDLVAYFADSFDCSTNEPMTFTAENTGNDPFSTAVRNAAVEAGILDNN